MSKLLVKILVGIVIIIVVLLCSSITAGDGDVVVAKTTKLNMENCIVSAVIVDVVENRDDRIDLVVGSPKPIDIANCILKELSATDTHIIDITEKNRKLVIDFTSDSSVFNLGTAGEMAILDSLSKTFLDSLSYESVEFNKDGKAYSSGHFYFEKGEPYMTIGDLNGDK